MGRRWRRERSTEVDAYGLAYATAQVDRAIAAGSNPKVDQRLRADIERAAARGRRETT
jgi:hypothetical protein